MINNKNTQGFPKGEWSINRLYVRRPRLFFEESRGSPLRLLTYKEVEMRYAIDPFDIQTPKDRDFHFVTDRVERNGRSNIPPGHIYMKAGRFYLGYPRDDAALEIGRDQLAEIGVDEKLIDYQNSIPVGNGYFAIRLLATPFLELMVKG